MAGADRVKNAEEKSILVFTESGKMVVANTHFKNQGSKFVTNKSGAH